MIEALSVIPVALVTAVITTVATLFIADKKLRRDYQLEYAAERIAQQLMMDKSWRLRSFDTIKRHLGGFGDDELRRILVRSGAIRFVTKKDKTELWGLLERNVDRLGAIELDVEPETRPL